MRFQNPNGNARRWVAVGGLLTALLAASWAQAGPFTRLQVLLPGETAAPGTPGGKTGAPDAQTVGVPFTFTVRACDEDWQTVTDVTDALRFSSTDVGAGLPGDTPLVGGELSLTAVFNSAGSFTISVDDLSDGTIPVAVSGTATTVVLAGFQFADIKQKHNTAGVAFGTEITALDPDGNVVAGYNGPVSLQQQTSYGLGRIEPEVVHMTGGVWSGDVTLFRADETNINRGNVNLYAFLAGDSSRNGTSNPFLVHPGPLGRVQIVLPGETPLPGSVTGVEGTPATQGAAQPFQVSLYSTDDFWNPLSSNHQVRITSSDPAASTPVTVALSGGQGSVAVGLVTSGSQTLSIADLSDASIQGMTSAPVMVIPSAAHHFEVDPMPATVTAGTPVSVTIRATDAGGNTLASFAGDVNLAANTGPGSMEPENITFSSGTWTGEVTFFGAGGSVQFTCSDYATPPHLGSSDPFQVVPGPYTALQVILPGQTAQGGTDDGVVGDAETQAAGVPFQIQIRAVDGWHNRVTGVANDLTVTSSDPYLGVPEGTALVNGEAFVDVTVFKAGQQTISVADAVESGKSAGTSSEFTVTAGPYARLLLLAPGETAAPGSETGRDGTATDQSISYLFTVTVHATDQWWNPVGGVADMVRLTSTDAMAQLPDDTAMVDGTAEMGVRLATGGFQQLTASNVTRPSQTPSTTQVRAISSGLHLEAEIAETVIQAGVPFNLTVRVTNDAGAVMQEINSFVTVEVRNATTGAPGRGELANTSFQLLQGQRTIAQTYTFAEDIVLHVTDDLGNQPALTGALDVRPGQPANLELSSDPTWVRASRSARLTAVVTDAFGNGVPDQPVTFATAAGDSGTLSVPDLPVEEKSVSASTDGQGVAEALYTAPRHKQTTTVSAWSGALNDAFELVTALVDPNAPGGHVTNYPNPFHPDEAPTTIVYVLDSDAAMRMRIYTLSGGLVLDRTYAAGGQGGLAGQNEIQWDGRNGVGEPVASGGYILHLEAEGNGNTQHVMRRKVGVVW